MEKWYPLTASLAWILYSIALAVDVPSIPTTCSESAPPPQEPLAVRKGSSPINSIEIIGLFDVHEGSRCHLLRLGGVEQTMMTLGVVEDRLQKKIGNDTKIGFRAFDTCSSVQTTIQRLVYGLIEANSLNQSCLSKFVGVIGSSNPEVQHHVGSFLASLGIPYFPLQITSLKYEIEAMTEVLLELKWLKVATFSANDMLQEEFRKAADSKDICISSSVVLSMSTRSDAVLQSAFSKVASTQTQVVIVLGSASDLQLLYETAMATNSSVHYWLLAGLESDESVLNLLFGPEHPIILFKRSATFEVPDRDFSDAYEFGASLKRLNLVQSYVEYLGNCGHNESDQSSSRAKCKNQNLRPMSPLWAVTLEAAERLVNLAYESHAENETDHNETESTTTEKIEIFKGQEIEIWTYEQAVGKYAKHKEMQVGHYGGGQLLLIKKRLNVFRFMGSGWFKIPEYHCKNDCPSTCLNFETISPTASYDNVFSRIYHHWRNETWVTVMLTISCLGVLVTIIVIVYFTVKSFQEDCEEKNQAFSIVTLIAVGISYSCTILFMYHKDSSSCSKRITAVGVAYASMLAPILSRVFLMIAAELEGIHGHISGLLQSILCCFIFSVQIALASCYWWMYPNSVQYKYKCISDKTLTLSYLSYSMFLSVLWLVSSLFTARSRRNNREGLLIHFGSIAVCVIWLVWYLMFFLLSPRWSEFTVCFGLVATATAVLTVVFMPKAYRMVAMAAAHEQVSMQPVIFASSSSRSPNMSIYESVNHGYNADKDGYVVDVFRDECDSPAPRKMTHL